MGERWKKRGKVGLTGIFGVFGTHILVAGVQDILIHEGRAGGHLAEEGDFHGLADLDALALLHEDLARVLAAVLAVEGGHAVLLGVVALFEGLERGHEVVAARDTRGDHPLRDAGGDGALNDGGNGVHGPHHLRLELRRDVQLDLLEKIFGGAEAAND